MTSLQAGSPGTQACINAVSDIIGELDNTIMLATAGTLQAKSGNETFVDHKENILKAAKALIEDTKCLIARVASSEEQLLVAAQNVFATFNQLVEVVKYAAESLGSSNSLTQVLLISAVKNVATALIKLVLTTKAACGKSVGGPEMSNLTDSARQAGSAVIRATDNLVGAAQQAIEHNDERSILVNKRIKCGMVQELMAREEIILKERELEVAREKLAALRKAKYGNRSPDE